ncbi:MAG: hypothetical protein CMC84_07930 [Flavobacteriaceae bacterium]|nr:hypothetical protein [Flavobacteriaceae bacterium]|tara:strand:- start:6869 stop:8005 length:1137 start_codon:yes stop_codon:yes gene_type:complete
MKKKIYYWSPFVGRIATIRSVLNSMIGLKRYRGINYNINLINCYGEWNNFRSRLKREKINVLDLQKQFSFDTDLYGFFFSRLIYFFTLIISYKKFKALLIKDKPDFLIVHLLTFIPFILYLNNNFHTKLILRISGKPQLNFIRSLLWKMSNKNIDLVFCPSIETMNYLKKKNIFDKKKLRFLPDPVLFEEEIKTLSKKENNFILNNHPFFVSIGRLTKQKNHELLINLYQSYDIKEKLLIVGDGELKNYLSKLIRKFRLEKKIFLLRYRKNIFFYIKKAEAVIIPSMWEDPGFVMIESAYSKKSIICSDCPSGPKEFIGKNRGGFLFSSDSLISLKNSIKNFLKSNKNNLNKKISYAKKKSKLYTIENHSKMISKYLH